MEISIKQGRVIMKLPRPSHYIAAVKDLFDFHGLETSFHFDELARRLETSERTRNLLVRSVYMRDSSNKQGTVHLARSPWDPGPGGETQPETQKVDRKFLASRRKEVDDAIRAPRSCNRWPTSSCARCTSCAAAAPATTAAKAA
jgi:hypothetical protein